MKQAKTTKSKKIRRLTERQIEQALQHVLTSTLALYVLNKSSKPVSRVVQDLVEVQFNSAQLIGMILKLQSVKMNDIDLDNALAGVFSFIPFGEPAGQNPPSDEPMKE
jgi:hypothetical protein